MLSANLSFVLYLYCIYFDNIVIILFYLVIMAVPAHKLFLVYDYISCLQVEN